MSLTVNALGRIASPVAPLQREPRVSSAQISQLVAGHVVQLLEQQEDWWRVVGDDAYEGWMHRGYLDVADGSEGDWNVSLGATVCDEQGVQYTLPLGARVTGHAQVVAGEILNAADARTRFPASPAAVVRTATTHFSGASYLWGGVTPWGCDCSGLVQTVFALHGVRLPRDAWQQAEKGTAVSIASPLDSVGLGAIAEGDLLFFSDRDDRRITHVGIAMRDNRMVHSALGRGGVREELLSSDEAYVQRLRRNFVCARRVL